MKKQKDTAFSSGGFMFLFGFLATVGYIFLLPVSIEDSSASVVLVTLLYIVFGLCSIILGIYGVRNWYKRNKGQSSKDENEQGKMRRYKVEWLWDSACEVYCKNNNKNSGELSGEDEAKIYELAGNDVALLLTWIIKHDFFRAEDDIEEYVKEVKSGKTSGSDFLSDVCDYKLSRDDFSDEITGFIDDYFQHDGEHQSGCFEDDYESFITDDLQKEMFTVEFSWDEYKAFKKYIDKAYRKYKKLNGNE